MNPTNLTKSILLVEDNPMDVDLTRRAFSRRKLVNPLVVARDGQEALDLLASWPPDRSLPAVILLDLKLPRVDGLEVLRQVKSHPRWKTLPVVVLTTSSDNADIQTAYELGANSYIVKPVDFEKFMEVATQINLYWLVTNQPPDLEP
jgi:hypothetical protein